MEIKGKALTEEEIDNICEKLQEEDLRNMCLMEDELAKYRRLFGPLPGKTVEGKTTNNKELTKK